MLRFLVVILTLASPSFAAAQWSEYMQADKISGLRVHRVVTPAIENDRFAYNNKYLVLQCHEGDQIELFVNWNQYLDNENIPLEYRIDDKPAEKVISIPSTDGTATFIPLTGSALQPSIVEQMIAGLVFVVRAEDYRRTPTDTVSFSLTGFTSAYNNACSYHSQYAEYLDSPESRANRQQVLEASQERYVAGIARMINRRWRRPAGISEACKIEIEQSTAGEVLSISPVECGDETKSLYQSAVKAVETAGRFPIAPSPSEFQSKIRVTFK